MNPELGVDGNFGNGDTWTFTAQPLDGYYFDHWSLSGDNYVNVLTDTDEATLTFSYKGGNNRLDKNDWRQFTAIAYFTAAAPTYTLTINSVGSAASTSGSTVTPTSGSSFAEGTVVDLSATPNASSRLVGFFANRINTIYGYTYSGLISQVTMDENKTVYALFSSDSYQFEHVDVEMDGTLTIEHRVNGELESSETLEVSTSNVSAVINGTTYTNFTGDSSANEWRKLGLSYSWPSAVTIHATLTDKSDPSRTFDFEYTFTGNELLTAYAHCPGSESGGTKGLDFVLSASSIQNTITHDVTFATTTGGTIGGGTANIEHTGLLDGSDCPTPPTPAANSGYDFLGWTMNGGTTLYTTAEVDAMTINADTTFTAQFSDTGNNTVFLHVYVGNPQQSPVLIADYTITDINSTGITLLESNSNWSTFLNNLDGLTAEDLNPYASLDASQYYGNGSINLEPRTTEGEYDVYIYIKDGVISTTYDVYYVDGNGNNIYPPKEDVTGYAGDFVTEVPVTVLGYTSPASQTITLQANESDNVITFVYTVNQYTLTFHDGYSGNISSELVDYGSTIVYPSDPTRTGYTFDGWDSTATTMPASDLTITAQWTVNQYTLTFHDGYSGNISSELVDYGSTINYPTVGREGYTFDGWDSTATTMPASDLTITAQWTVNQYTLTFHDGYSGNISSELVDYGSTIVYPSDPTRTGYTFDGWDSTATTMPAHDVTITAQWTVNQYTLTFHDGYSGNISSELVDYGSTIVYPSDPTRTGYTFDGWDSTATTMPASDLTITAQWTVNQYTLTFHDGYSGNISSELVDYGSTIVYPSDPTRTGYTFDGWDSTATTMPASDLTITAQWTVNQYTLTFHDGYSGNISSGLVDYGSTIVYPSDPTRTGYTFDGWDSTATTMPASDLTITAQWTVNQYTLTFHDGYSGNISSGLVDYGSTIVYPSDPTRTGYTFDGWDSTATTMPASDLTITAQWTVNQYTLTFHDGYSGNISSELVDYGSTIVYPSDPTRTGYTFDGWDSTATTMPASDLTITAQWTVNQYTLTFHDGYSGNISSELVDYGSTIVYPSDPTRTGYTFDGWDSTATTMPASDLTITAQWTVNQYTLTFHDGYSGNISSGLVDYGSTIVYPSDPTRTGYTFDGWDSTATTMPASDLTITAQWTVNQYTLTFHDGYSGNISSGLVDYGSTIVYPSDPTRTGYTFDGWDSTATTMPASDLTITAQWTVNQYTLTFHDGYSGNISSGLVDYGSTIVYPSDPTRTGHTFDGWDSTATTMPASDLTITAQWTVNQYTLTFHDGYSGNISSELVDYGSTIVYPSDPTRTGYTFDGWDSTATTMPASDLTITAQWTVNQYTLTFHDGYSGNISSGLVDYGSTIVYPSDPTRTGHTFDGWDSTATTMPASDLTITAQWTVNQYTLTFHDGYSGNISSGLVDYGSTIVYPSDPTRTGYTFDGWDSTATTMPASDLTITAQWTVNQYTVRFFRADGVTQIGTTQTVTWGEAATLETAPARVGMTFAGWVLTGDDAAVTTSLSNVQENINAVASYRPTVYTVRFEDFDGTLLGTDQVNYGEDAVPPADPTREGYDFTGWSPSYNNVTGNLTVVAEYKIKTFTVTFVDFDGTVIDEQTVEWNTGATAPEAPTREGYDFTGWDKEFDPVTSNLTVTAQYTGVAEPTPSPESTEIPPEEPPTTGGGGSWLWWLLLIPALGILIWLLLAWLTIVPIAEAVTRNADGTMTIQWGYENRKGRKQKVEPEDSELTALSGQIISSSAVPPVEAAPPVEFEKGRVENVFTTIAAANSVVQWKIRNRKAKVDLSKGEKK